MYDADDGFPPARSAPQQTTPAQRVDLVAHRGTQLVEQEVTALDDRRAHLLVRSVQILVKLQTQTITSLKGEAMFPSNAAQQRCKN